MNRLDGVNLASPDIYGVNTHEGGSAKVQRMPLIPELFNAQSFIDILEAVEDPKNSQILYTFSDELVTEGYTDPAAAVRFVADHSSEWLVEARSEKGLSKNKREQILFVLKYILPAMFKTAGNLTMYWGGWTVNPDIESPIITPSSALGIDTMDYSVQIPVETFERIKATNQIIYNVLNSLLNQSAEDIGNPSDVAGIRKRAIEIAADGSVVINFGNGTGKDSIKIDYKLGNNGRTAMVDVNAGNMGIADTGDAYANAIRNHLGMENIRVTDSVVEAIMATYNARELSFPTEVSVVVLDQEMYQMNQSDADAYVEAIKRFAASRGFFINVNIITTEQLNRHGHGENSIAPLSGQWNNGTQLAFRYTGRASLQNGSYQGLQNQNVQVIPEPFTNLMADKVSTTLASQIGAEQLPSGIILPAEVQSKYETAYYAAKAEELIEEAFGIATEQGWDGIVIKTATKFRKAGVSGVDYPTAFIYPNTEMGRMIALQELKALLKNLAKEEVGAGSYQLSFNQLFADGIEVAETGESRQVEIRLFTTLAVTES